VSGMSGSSMGQKPACLRRRDEVDSVMAWTRATATDGLPAADNYGTSVYFGLSVNSRPPLERQARRGRDSSVAAIDGPPRSAARLCCGVGGQEVVEIVVDRATQRFAGPRGLEAPTFHQKQVDLIALPSQRPSVVGAIGQQRVDVPAARRSRPVGRLIR
jgi:hypothetical protein